MPDRLLGLFYGHDHQAHGHSIAKIVLGAVFVMAIAVSAFAQAPLLTLLPTNSTPQRAVLEGTATAASARFHVAGKPRAFDVGLVEVYDRLSNGHLISIENPDPVNGEYFGGSLALENGILVVGKEFGGTISVFDLNSSSPGSPIHTLLLPDDPMPSYEQDRFGKSLSISSGVIAVGSPNFEDSYFDGGHVYAYDLNSTTPEIPFFRVENTTDYQFGQSVSIHGSTIAVGNPYAIDGLEYAGEVQVFDLDSSSPQVPSLIIPTTRPGVYGAFGFAVAVFENLLAVSSINENGSVYVYDLDSGTATVPLYELPASKASNTRYGEILALQDSRLIVPSANFNNAAVRHVDVFDLDSANPTVPTLVIYPPTNAGSFFNRVSLFGDNLLVGAPYSSFRIHRGGVTFVYDLDSQAPGAPTAILYRDSMPTDDHFGSAVAVSGNLIAVAAKDSDNADDDFDAGLVYVFDNSRPNPLEPILVLSSPAPATFDRFGSALAMSGNILVVGMPNEEWVQERAGSVFVYDLESTTPDQPVKILRNPAPTFWGHFGQTVDIDRNLIGVGAPEDGYPGVADGHPGVAYVYDVNDSGTDPIWTFPNPIPAMDRNYGSTVRIEGETVVVSAPADDGFQQREAVYLFDLNDPDPAVTVEILHRPMNETWQEFGQSVQVSDEYLIVGARFRDRVHVYRRNDLSLPLTTIVNPQPNVWGDFGEILALSGHQLAVASGTSYATFTSQTKLAYLYDLESATPSVSTGAILNPGPHRDTSSAILAWSGADLVLGMPYVDTLNLDQGAVFTYQFGTPFTVSPSTLEVGFGIITGGDIDDLAASDNVDLSLVRDVRSVFGVIDFAVTSTSPIADPDLLSFTLESSVFARSSITQTIELFDYASGTFELVDSRNAGRFDDLEVTVEAAGDVSRFVEPGTRQIKARIRYRAQDDRARFAANVDRIGWLFE